jgi:addiction module RelE/StbE family toxin
MKIVWTDPADSDREMIVLYIAQDNPSAAIKMDKLFTDAADSLIHFPLKGRTGRVPGTRELVVHRTYLLVYSLDTENDAVYVRAVIHTSRQWPPEADDGTDGQ